MRRLTLAAGVLTFVVVVVGAYVRLSDAGLGCPDWPLCYGKPIPDATEDAKAWKEMGHRYLAGALGILIFALALAAWRTRQSPWLATAIAALVVFQATLGKWTVTMLLKPAIVVAHLAGGMALLGLLTWFFLERTRSASPAGARALRLPAAVALLVLALQILLGGWVSANYAALACPDLPLCLGQALPPMDFANAFHVLRELGRTDAGELLPQAALVAIHWSHRMLRPGGRGRRRLGRGAGFPGFEASGHRHRLAARHPVLARRRERRVQPAARARGGPQCRRRGAARRARRAKLFCFP